MNCPPAVREALGSLPGVTKVVVDFNKKTATCTVDPEKFVEEKAIKALTDAGYEGSYVIKKKEEKEEEPRRRRRG